MTNTASALDTAVAFIKRRIEKEAARSGEPLSSEERFLLNHLPSESVLPKPYAAGPKYPTVLLPRDRSYERLCKLAQTAYHNDLRLDPSAREWQYAAAVTQVNHDPIFWLLEWSGVKERSRSCDRWLLVISGVVLVVIMLPLMLLMMSRHPNRLQWAELIAVFFVFAGLLQLASRRITKRQLMRTIERR